MNERDSTLLNDYFNGLLSPEDARSVRDRAASDPAFGEEFTLRTEMEDFPRRAEKRKEFTATLRSVEKDFFQEGLSSESPAQRSMTAKVTRGRWLAIAAGIALLACALWFFNRPGLPDYRQYADFAPLSLTVRGVADQNKSEAEKAFVAKNYPEALAALERVLADEPANITAQLYKGICLLELDRASEARAVWKPIADGSSALRDEAGWLTALSYLKEKNYPACRQVLQSVEAGTDHYRNAQKLLEELP